MFDGFDCFELGIGIVVVLMWDVEDYYFECCWVIYYGCECFVYGCDVCLDVGVVVEWIG